MFLAVLLQFPRLVFLELLLPQLLLGTQLFLLSLQLARLLFYLLLLA